jgi:hypothetical protein
LKHEYSANRWRSGKTRCRHHLGIISKILYLTRDVGLAGISRLVAMPHAFRHFPREFQARTASRAILPAGAGWLKPRLREIPITLGCRVVSASSSRSRLLLKLDDGTKRLVDHALLATGFRVDVSTYPFLSQSLAKQLSTVPPVLKGGLESSVPGLHFAGKPAARSRHSGRLGSGAGKALEPHCAQLVGTARQFPGVSHQV